MESTRERAIGARSFRIEEIVIDCSDPGLLARFWSEALGYELCEVYPDEASIEDPQGTGPGIFFQKVPEAKMGKNRVHIDLTVPEGEFEASVEHLERVGATRVDVGQGPDRAWATMADPEGNEFCVVV